MFSLSRFFMFGNIARKRTPKEEAALTGACLLLILFLRG